MSTIAQRKEDRAFDRPRSSIHAADVNQIVVDPSKFPIKPSHLRKEGCLMGSFGNSETEASASWLRSFALNTLAKDGDVFRPFYFHELDALYRKKYPDHAICLNRLVMPAASFYIRIGTVMQGGGFLVTPSTRRHPKIKERDYTETPCGKNTVFFWTTDLIVRLFDHTGHHKTLSEEEVYLALCGGSNIGCSAIPSRWISNDSYGCLTDDPEVERAILETIKENWATCLPKSISTLFAEAFA